MSTVVEGLTKAELLVAESNMNNATRRYVDLLRKRLKELAIGEHSDATYVGVNVHLIQGNRSESVTAVDITGLYNKDGVRVSDEVNLEFDEDILSELVRNHDHPEPSESSTWAYNVLTGQWRLDMNLRDVALTLTQAIDYAIFALRTYVLPEGVEAVQGTDEATLADVEAKCPLIIQRLTSAKDYMVKEGLVIE